jgi:hypothetical protein
MVGTQANDFNVAIVGMFETMRTALPSLSNMRPRRRDWRPRTGHGATQERNTIYAL